MIDIDRIPSVIEHVSKDFEFADDLEAGKEVVRSYLMHTEEYSSHGYLAIENFIDEFLAHYGTPRHSGRYPWGSGENPQRNKTLRGRINDIKKENPGISDAQIAKELNMSTTEVRARLSIEKNSQIALEQRQIAKLAKKGYSVSAISDKLGIPWSTVKTRMDEDLKQKQDKLTNTANTLMSNVDQKGFIDVGKGVSNWMGVTDTHLKTAISIAEQKGYTLLNVDIPQPTNPGKNTTLKVLAPEGTTKKQIYDNLEKISTITDYTTDGGVTYEKIQPPKSIDSSRIFVRYAEDGGADKDGVIELRRNVPDVSLGESSYAQVRIAVDDKYYLKGMAMYSNDIPDGYDVLVNSNKKSGTPKEKAFKEMQLDADGNVDIMNPFGALISKQVKYEDSDGKTQLGVVNKVREEGEWNEWAKTLSSQFLSKQNLSLIQRQTDLFVADKVDEFEKIKRLTNNEVKQEMLMSFADGCDRAAVDLKAAALPNQRMQVILPVPSLKETECFAPNYPNGTTVALVRFPHGGTFEIPVLTVNNNQKDAKESIGTSARDAIGINGKTAERLSGADFDGDTVMVIPITSKATQVVSTPALQGLKDFDPKTSYPEYPGMKRMTSREKGLEMGSVSNLITDMTLQHATPDELERAVRHSMVVIDAYKHHLDYKSSEIDNGIPALKEKYQGGANRGAYTLISKASAETHIPERKEGEYRTDADGKTRLYKIDPDTGEKLYTETGRTKNTYDRHTVTTTDENGNKVKTREIRYDEDGNPVLKEVPKTQASTRMADTNDARTLISAAHTPQEEIYASFANKLKSLGNEARKEYLVTPNSKLDREAAKTYAQEVSSLKAKLNDAVKNAPRERQAIVLATVRYKAIFANNPDLSTKDKDKIKAKELAIARDSVGARGKESRISITDREWEAIQAHALSSTTVKSIFQHCDSDTVKSRATPRASSELTASEKSLIRARLASGYTIAEIAEAMGVSTSTISKNSK